MRLCVERDQLFVLLEPGFGPADARLLEQQLASLRHLSDVTVDFSRAADLPCAGLAALARTFTRLRGTRVHVRGLTLQRTCALQECADGAEPLARA